MVNFVWILASDSISSIPSGIAFEYLLPKGFVSFSIEQLVGSRIFIIERQSADRIIAVLTIDYIDEISEGANSGDYILKTNINASFRLCDSFADGAAFEFKPAQSLKYGMHKIDLITAKIAINLILDNLQSRYYAPGSEYFIQIGISASASRTPKSLARQALLQIIRKHSLQDIWSKSVEFSGRPFSEFAFQLLTRQGINFNEGKVKQQLLMLDPLCSLLESNESADPASSDKFRYFDSDFQLIEPNQISSRSFNSNLKSSYGFLAGLIKTEQAEKRHQEILREICLYLSSMSINAYQSTSIDLMFDIADGIKIVEIKSAHNDNFFSQAAKGAAQLAFYARSLEPDFTNLKVLLVIEKISNSNYMTQTLSALDYLNIPYFVIDQDMPAAVRYSGLIG